MNEKIDSAWKALKPPANESITSKWYFEKGFEAANVGFEVPEEETIKEILGQMIFKCELGGDSVQKQLHEWIKSLAGQKMVVNEVVKENEGCE